jgi:hypothetical protein
MPLEEVGRRPGILINKNTKGWAHPALHFSTKTLALPLPSLRSLRPREAPFLFGTTFDRRFKNRSNREFQI